ARAAVGLARRANALEKGVRGPDLCLQFSGAAAETNGAASAALRPAQLRTFRREAERGACRGGKAIQQRLFLRSGSNRQPLWPTLPPGRHGRDNRAWCRVERRRLGAG